MSKTVATKQPPRPSPTHSKSSDWSACQVPPVGYNHLGRVEIILFIIVFWNCQGLRQKRKEIQNYLVENQIVNQEWKNEHFNAITYNEALAIEIELQNGGIRLFWLPFIAQMEILD